MAAPLLRVVDFSTHLSGPLASQLLRSFGAEVVKIESPRDGDGNRGLAPLIEGQGMFHLAFNSGTRSVAVSSRSPHWRTVVAAAVQWADAVVVGGRPDDVQRLGLGFDELAQSKSELIYCLITGYGEGGPWRDFPAHGQQPDAMAGLAAVEWVDGLPETPGPWRSTGTTLAAVFAALGIMAAVRRQALDGGPQHVAVSLWGCALWWNWRDLNTHAALGHGWPDYRDLGTRYAMYPTADGRVLILCPIERKFWEPFCDLLDLPAEARARGEWDSSRMDFGVGPAYAGERRLIAERMVERTLAEWEPLLREAEIPFAPVLTWAEAVASEHAVHNGVMRTMPVGDRTTEIATPPVAVGAKSGAGGDSPLPPAPALGEHSAEFLREVGLDDLADEVTGGRVP